MTDLFSSKLLFIRQQQGHYTNDECGGKEGEKMKHNFELNKDMCWIHNFVHNNFSPLFMFCFLRRVSRCRAQHCDRPGQSDGSPREEDHFCFDQSGPGWEEPGQPQQSKAPLSLVHFPHVLGDEKKVTVVLLNNCFSCSVTDSTDSWRKAVSHEGSGILCCCDRERCGALTL